MWELSKVTDVSICRITKVAEGQSKSQSSRILEREGLFTGFASHGVRPQGMPQYEPMVTTLGCSHDEAKELSEIC